MMIREMDTVCPLADLLSSSDLQVRLHHLSNTGIYTLLQALTFIAVNTGTGLCCWSIAKYFGSRVGAFKVRCHAKKRFWQSDVMSPDLVCST